MQLLKTFIGSAIKRFDIAKKSLVWWFIALSKFHRFVDSDKRFEQHLRSSPTAPTPARSDPQKSALLRRRHSLSPRESVITTKQWWGNAHPRLIYPLRFPWNPFGTNHFQQAVPRPEIARHDFFFKQKLYTRLALHSKKSVLFLFFN